MKELKLPNHRLEYCIMVSSAYRVQSSSTEKMPLEHRPALPFHESVLWRTMDSILRGLSPMH